MFDDVFPSFKDACAPTPSVTPLLGSTSFGTPFGGDFHDTKGSADDSAPEALRWDRAWHTATTFLSLPRETVSPEQALRKGFDERRWIKEPSPETRNAIAYVLSHEWDAPGAQVKAERSSLLEWYLLEVSTHFAGFQLSSLKTVRARLLSSV